MRTAEQEIRDILDRMGVDSAQEFTAGELVELANIYVDALKWRRLKGGDPALAAASNPTSAATTNRPPE